MLHLTPTPVLLERPPAVGRTAWRVTCLEQLSAPEDVTWLDSRRLPRRPSTNLAPGAEAAFQSRTLTAVNRQHPRWRDALAFVTPSGQKKRVHLLAVGDVGSVLLTTLKLLGGDCISAIGISDLNEASVQRWVAELSQVSFPWDYDALPTVEALQPEQLFDCDVFLFAAAKAVPSLDSGVSDVRMAQFAANRPLVEHFARQARDAGFRGLFAVLSDPVDPLCKAAWLSSNQDADGRWDGLGLLAEQIQGFGLGVMNARAAAIARQDARFASFLTEGRSFGPHGHGLVLANSIAQYDDALSQELTAQVEQANLNIRALGFKPYVAPAISSGTIQLLLTLRGAWHCGSICLGDIWFGVRNRFTRYGLETEALPLPDALFARIQESEALLHRIL